MDVAIISQRRTKSHLRSLKTFLVPNGRTRYLAHWVTEEQTMLGQ